MLDKPKRKAHRLHEIAWAKKQSEREARPAPCKPLSGADADYWTTAKQFAADLRQVRHKYIRHGRVRWVKSWRHQRLADIFDPLNDFPSAAARRNQAVAAGRPNSCQVCGDEGVICWDHDHSTGLFRGWLCALCNTALGMVRDNPQTLRDLAEYLERSKNNS